MQDFEITPRIAYFVPRSALGTVTRVSDVVVATFGRAGTSVGFEASGQVSFPGRHLSTRIMGLTTLPADVSGTFSCLPPLPCLALFIPARADLRVTAGVLDMVYSPANGSMRPYGVLGAGLKHYSFRWKQDAQGGMADFASNAPAAHVGAGIELNALSALIRLELADYWSPAGPDITPPPGSSAWSVPGRRAQHDLTFSAGYRLFRF